MSLSSPSQASYHLKPMDPAVVEKVLQLLDQKCDALCAAPCDVLGTSVEDIFLNLTAHQTGSVSLDSAERSISSSGEPSLDAALPSLTGPTMMNLATNILYNRASNASGDIEHPPNLIYASYAAFLHLASGTLVDLKWVAFFGAAMFGFPVPSCDLEIPSSTSWFMALCCSVFSYGLIS
ncbi:hypothetical protein C8R48DRAFT_780755 [Suillus tomentosus]|nr:hypothetical protein C8R48DRAFT_780755 [Suillus tomentosus]